MKHREEKDKVKYAFSLSSLWFNFLTTMSADKLWATALSTA